MKSSCLDRSSMAKLNFNHINAEQILKRPPSPIFAGFFFGGGVRGGLSTFFRKVGLLPTKFLDPRLFNICMTNM